MSHPSGATTGGMRTMSGNSTGDQSPEDQLVPPKRRKTRLVQEHKSGILIPPWWRKNRAFMLLALSVVAVIGAIVVIGSAADRVGHVPDAGVETLDDLAAHTYEHEEPLPSDVYEGAPVVVPSSPEDGISHAIEDPGAQVRAEPIGELIGELGLDEEQPTTQPAGQAGAVPPPSEGLSPPSEPAPEVPSTAATTETTGEQTARLPEPSTPVPSATQRPATEEAVPAWIRFALPYEPEPGKPLIAIVIDDVGVSRRHSAASIALPGPLTMSFLTYADGVNQQAEEARRQGHEIMLHVPMEPSSETIDPGPNALLAGMPEPELRARLTWAMRQLDGYVGINNHMGSRFTQDQDGMRTVLETISRSGHFFLDSRTSGGSVAGEIAHDLGMPFASRNVFLDHEDDIPVIRRQLEQVERLARQNGAVIAIGHPRPKTTEVLREWIPTLQAKGLQLAPVTAIVRQQWLAEIAAQLEAEGDG